MAEVKQDAEHIHLTDSRGRDVKGKVIRKIKGNPLVNLKTGVRNTNTVKLYIQPDDGSKAFWTESMAVVEE